MLSVSLQLSLAQGGDRSALERLIIVKPLVSKRDGRGREEQRGANVRYGH